ncbi:hypothetical protein K443DRAFT_321366 [Laccaria amethystina LaAM-08-1]|jgi:hypothetical protein|uniref:Uncharacterized protein n=1 Tax=Laccaria amethystina LaAM-08-1 TaxID=1095629 RepID=A0A0C9WU65_9AGAR|nr:hypothetical protein K443DRAFT_321366 [Laccaria amethystina LaAM-08-1]
MQLNHFSPSPSSRFMRLLIQVTRQTSHNATLSLMSTALRPSLYFLSSSCCTKVSYSQPRLCPWASGRSGGEQDERLMLRTRRSLGGSPLLSCRENVYHIYILSVAPGQDSGNALSGSGTSFCETLISRRPGISIMSNPSLVWFGPMVPFPRCLDDGPPASSRSPFREQHLHSSLRHPTFPPEIPGVTRPLVPHGSVHMLMYLLTS